MRPQHTTRAAVALIAAAIVAWGFATNPMTASAATTTFTVTTALDPTSGTACPATSGNPCSLRAAIAAAETAGGTDAIVFDPSVSGPITLATGAGAGPLSIAGHVALTITGPASGMVVQGDGTERVLDISNINPAMPTSCSPAVTPPAVTLDHLTLTKGAETSATAPDDGFGGGVDIDCGASLTMLDSTLSDNTATMGGGGINVNTAASVTLVRTTLSGNSVSGTAAGGGIEQSTAGTLTVIDSTITGNTAAGAGGGILGVTGGTLSLVNDTVAANTAGTTGGGIAAAGTVTAANTIIAKNSSPDCSGTVTDSGDNLEDGTSCGFTSHAVNADPKLGALADNGGPTQTQALLPGSPAIAAGSDTVCATSVSSGGAGGVDQRGVTRPQSSHCDIGAFEDIATTLQLSAIPSTAPGDVTLRATVTPSTDIGGSPAGTVAFTKGGTSLGSAPLSGGEASVVITLATASDPTFTAQFTPTNAFLGSTGQVAFTPAPTPTPTPPVPDTGAAPTSAWLPGAALGTGAALLLLSLSLARRRRRPAR